MLLWIRFPPAQPPSPPAPSSSDPNYNPSGVEAWKEGPSVFPFFFLAVFFFFPLKESSILVFPKREQKQQRGNEGASLQSVQSPVPPSS